jgi:hypothetical protein
MFSRILIQSYTGVDSLTSKLTVEAGAEAIVNEPIPAASNPLALGFTMDVSQLKLLYMLAKGDLIVKTNSNGSPPNTFTLKAGVAFAWATGGLALTDTAGVAVTTDITSLQVVNASAEAVDLQIRALYDPTV